MLVYLFALCNLCVFHRIFTLFVFLDLYVLFYLFALPNILTFYILYVIIDLFTIYDIFALFYILDISIMFAIIILFGIFELFTFFNLFILAIRSNRDTTKKYILMHLAFIFHSAIIKISFLCINYVGAVFSGNNLELLRPFCSLF